MGRADPDGLGRLPGHVARESTQGRRGWRDLRSHVDGATIALSPQRAIEIQSLLGSDIAMQLDECIALPATVPDIERAMQLSLRWAERCRRAFDHGHGRALFGIVQGGDIANLRIESARALVDIGFHGYAIGGLAVASRNT
jgi:tRNA-guanine transglycosylases, various specificities